MLLAEAAAVLSTAQSSSVALNVGVRRYDAAIKASRFADTQIKGMVKCMEVVTHHRAAHLFRRRSGCERGKLSTKTNFCRESAWTLHKLAQPSRRAKSTVLWLLRVAQPKSPCAQHGRTKSGLKRELVERLSRRITCQPIECVATRNTFRRGKRYCLSHGTHSIDSRQ